MPPKLEGVDAQSIANPVVQPADAQLLEQTTIGSLRSAQHLDVNGNPISKLCEPELYRTHAHEYLADPDLSNPTRPRMERPLDTIRSFEKAIDNGYKRRSSMMRGGTLLLVTLYLFSNNLTTFHRIVRPESTTRKQTEQLLRCW
jgi:hypothetical protein